VGAGPVTALTDGAGEVFADVLAAALVSSAAVGGLASLLPPPQADRRAELEIREVRRVR
jgi:hypothetical protein